MPGGGAVAAACTPRADLGRAAAQLNLFTITIFMRLPMFLCPGSPGFP